MAVQEQRIMSTSSDRNEKLISKQTFKFKLVLYTVSVRHSLLLIQYYCIECAFRNRNNTYLIEFIQLFILNILNLPFKI